MEDSIVVATRLRDRATTEGNRRYWQAVIDGIERDRKRESRR